MSKSITVKSRTPAQIAATERMVAANAAARAAAGLPSKVVTVAQALEGGATEAASYTVPRVSGFAATALQMVATQSKIPEVKKAVVSKVRAAPTGIEANGVKRPAAESKAGQAWEQLDIMFAAKGEIITREFVAICVELGLNKNSVTDDLARWRKFNGRSIR